ncbi:hypothetical protein [Streptomyces albidocamelliae]|uniref:hypothetical protein n=1 Tax=Streptomyces albidocamelliae TaxID=2981135 RepID=UPI00384B24D7
MDQTPPGVVQFTPHGSACSVQFGTGLTSAAPGSGKGYLSVPDIDAARTALLAARVEVDAVFHPRPDGPVEGLVPERRSYFSCATFRDPDGTPGCCRRYHPAPRRCRTRPGALHFPDRSGECAPTRGSRPRSRCRAWLSGASPYRGCTWTRCSRR